MNSISKAIGGAGFGISGFFYLCTAGACYYPEHLKNNMSEGTQRSFVVEEEFYVRPMQEILWQKPEYAIKYEDLHVELNELLNDPEVIRERSVYLSWRKNLRANALTSIILGTVGMGIGIIGSYRNTKNEEES